MERMATNGITLRGLALSKYRTVGGFATAIGWQRQKASRILGGVQDPSMTDIQELVDCLDIGTQEMFLSLFFPAVSKKWTGAAE